MIGLVILAPIVALCAYFLIRHFIDEVRYQRALDKRLRSSRS